MISPSDINLDTLPWWFLESKTQLPNTPCIYFAIDSKGVVQYIGRSINPKLRWRSHHRYTQLESIGGVRIACLSIDSPDLLPQIEQALIEWFNPLLNEKRLGSHSLDTPTDKRSEQRSLRLALSDEEWKKLDLICADTGLDKTNALRQLIRNYQNQKS